MSLQPSSHRKPRCSDCSWLPLWYPFPSPLPYPAHGRTADGNTFGNRLFDGEKLQELLGKDVAQHTRYDDDNHRNRNVTAQLLRNTDTDGGSDALRQEGNVGRMVEMEDEARMSTEQRLASTPETMPISTAR